MMENDFEIINKIHSDPKYLSIKKYQDGLTYEYMLSLLFNDNNNDDDEYLPIASYPGKKYGGLYQSKVIKEHGKEEDEIYTSSYFNFKDFKGISSKQTIVCDYRNYKKLHYGFNEFKLGTIDYMNSDAFTNIKVITKPIYECLDHLNKIELIEFILRVNGNIICSKTMPIDFSNPIICNFIDSPNYIINVSKNQKITIHARQNFLCSAINFKIEYDQILFMDNSRWKLSKLHKYIFKTTTDVICVAHTDKMAVRYFSQFIGTIHDDFKKFYIINENNLDTSNEETQIVEIYI